jgi:4a-hydroxytetrahydrobiopterin dehydratase
MELNKKNCEPCHAGATKATEREIENYLEALDGWSLDSSTLILKLTKTFSFTKYAESLTFVNRIADASEGEGHHPVMLFEFRQVTVNWWTHKIEGLHMNDFIMAAKCDGFYATMNVSLSS